LLLTKAKYLLETFEAKMVQKFLKKTTKSPTFVGHLA
jgi:hypothetical protein